MMNPADPKTFDPYRYADDNPVTYTDASGLSPNCGGMSTYAAARCWADWASNYTTGSLKAGYQSIIAADGRMTIKEAMSSGAKAAAARAEASYRRDKGIAIQATYISDMAGIYKMDNPSVGNYALGFGLIAATSALCIGTAGMLAVACGAGAGFAGGVIGYTTTTDVNAWNGGDALFSGGIGAATGGLLAGGGVAVSNINRVMSIVNAAESGVPGVGAAGAGGFSSFAGAKTALGSPGAGNVFDHVVEQSQIGRSGFAPQQIHNAFNLNPVSAEVNQLKANYYSTKQPFTNGGTVRDWLTGKSFADQHAFGTWVTNQILRWSDRRGWVSAKGATDVVALSARYEALGIAWDNALGTPAKANALFVRAHRIAVRLRESPAGRDALLTFLDHESRAVRLCAAAECLPYSPQRATAVLREVALSDGLHAVSAEMTLKEFEAGRLNMNW